MAEISAKTWKIVCTVLDLLSSEAYAITTLPQEGNVAKQIDFLRSDAGRRLVEETGYVAPAAGAKDIVLE